MTMANLMKALMQSAAQSQQGTAVPSGGQDPLSEVLGGLVGGGLERGGQGDQMLSVLEQIIAGQSGVGQAMSVNQNGTLNVNSNDPILTMLQPLIYQVSTRANIPPQVATVIASIAVHYLLASHPSTSRQAPMNLQDVVQELQTGTLSEATLMNSGIVNAVMQATGLSQQDAVGSLQKTFDALGTHIRM